ncbi:hypothetical protein MNBD_NITROSPINAE01-754 [hydrothermal vent metagenome]|uniref:Uncharacterized protein n=1 Tax=hydrothermal vent metagenome TaxID=652676 RepID=A0A3B1CFB9_9ZZZZ
MIRRLRNAVLLIYIVVAAYGVALWPGSRYEAFAAVNERFFSHRPVALSSSRILAENRLALLEKASSTREKKKAPVVARKDVVPDAVKRNYIRLRWARIGSSKLDSDHKLSVVTVKKTYPTIRMRMVRTMTEDSATSVKKMQAVKKKPKLIRTEPSRDRKIKKFRTVWRPWFGNLLQRFNWGGQVYDVYSTPISGDEYETTNIAGFGLRAGAGTFIVEPWIALIDGNVNLTSSRSDSESYDSSTMGLASFLRLTVFPQSRFPFGLFYGLGTNKTEYGSYTVSNNTSTYGFTQQYSPEGGAHYSLRYDKRFTDTIGSGEEERGNQQENLNNEQENVDLSISKRLGKHDLSFQATSNSSVTTGITAETEQARVTLDHDYTPWAGFTFDNSANFFRDKNISGSGALKGDEVISGFTRDVFQLTSYSYLNPASAPWRANFGARYLLHVNKIESSFKGDSLGGASTESSTTNLNAGFNYDFGRNLRGNASVNANRSVSVSRISNSIDQNVGLSYGSDTMSLFGMDYSWQYGTNLFNLVSDYESSFSIRTNLGHDLTKSYDLFKESNLTFSLSQGYYVDHRSAGSAIGTSVSSNSAFTNSDDRLTHSGSIAFNTRGMNTRSSFRLTGTDTRERGVVFREGGAVYQAVNFFAVFDMLIGKYQVLTGSFNIRNTTNNVNKEKSITRAVSSGGSASYRHGKAFGVRGLRFTSRMNVAEDYKFIPTFGNGNRQSTLEWNNELTFKIGRLETAAMFRMYRTNGTDRNLLLFRVMRTFGM